MGFFVCISLRVWMTMDGLVTGKQGDNTYFTGEKNPNCCLGNYIYRRVSSCL